jgi:hypothetical protein
MIRRARTRTRLRIANLCSDTQAERIRELAAENRLLRSIVRKIHDHSDVELSAYGPGRPEMTGQRFLAFDYSTVDLTPAEAALFDAITTEEPT